MSVQSFSLVVRNLAEARERDEGATIGRIVFTVYEKSIIFSMMVSNHSRSTPFEQIPIRVHRPPYQIDHTPNPLSTEDFRPYLHHTSAEP
jgi:hypothetical protein